MKNLLMPILFLLLAPPAAMFTGCAAAPTETSSAFQAQPSQRPLTLLMAGVRDETGEPVLNDMLIAYGVKNLVEEAFFETGRFIPLETNPEIRTEVERLAIQGWRMSGKDFENQVMPQARRLPSDVYVTAVFKSFSRSRTRSFVGPFSSGQVRVTVAVEVTLERRGFRPVSATGRGAGYTTQTAFIFEVDRNQIHFDRTSVGRAVQEAVKEAVNRLCRNI